MSHQENWVLGAAGFGSMRGLWADFEPTAGGEIVESRYPAVDSRRDGSAAAVVMSVGKGRVAVIGGPLGRAYAAHHAPALRESLSRVVARVFTPAVEVSGPPTVEVALRKKSDRRWLVHLSNMTAAQAGTEYAVVEWVPAVGPIAVTVALPGKPARVLWEPEGRELQGTWANGRFRTTVDRLEVHGAISIAL